MRNPDRITMHPKVMGDKPCIRATRLTVGMILGSLAAGQTADEILALYPYLEKEDIRQAVEYGAWRCQK